MFLDPGIFPYVTDLESAWHDLRAEYDTLSPESFVAWPESDLYEFGWKAFALIGLGHRFDPNCDRCPRTMAVLSAIPGIANAGFSLLAAGSRIRPHFGYTATVHRLHLGIKIPPNCGLTVGRETRSWAEGRVLAFDDTTEHSAWNGSDTDRAVLLLDVVRAGAKFDVTPAALQALEGYLRATQQ